MEQKNRANSALTDFALFFCGIKRVMEKLWYMKIKTDGKKPCVYVHGL